MKKKENLVKKKVGKEEIKKTNKGVTDSPSATEKKGQSFSHVMGQIIWLLGQSPIHRYLMIQELEWLVFPPVMMKQFMLFFNEKKQVVGAAFWAHVNKEVDERLRSGSVKLRPGEWKNGDNLWLIEIIAPFGKSNEMLDQLKNTAFQGKKFKLFGVDQKTGKREVQTMEGKSIIKDTKVTSNKNIKKSSNSRNRRKK